MISEFSTPLPGESIVETSSAIVPQESANPNSSGKSAEFTEALKLTQQSVGGEPAIDTEQSIPSAVIEANRNQQAAEPVTQGAQRTLVEPGLIHASKSISPRPTSFPILKIKLVEPVIDEVLFHPVEYFESRLSPPDSLVSGTESIIGGDVAVVEPTPVAVDDTSVDTLNQSTKNTIVPVGEPGTELLELEGVETNRDWQSRTAAADPVFDSEVSDLRIAYYEPLTSLVITQPAESTVIRGGAPSARETPVLNQQAVDVGAVDSSIYAADVSDSVERGRGRFLPSESRSDSLAQIPRPLPSLVSQAESSDENETVSPHLIQRLEKKTLSKPEENFAQKGTVRSVVPTTVIERKNAESGTESDVALVSDVVSVETSTAAIADSNVGNAPAKSVPIEVTSHDNDIQAANVNGASIIEARSVPGEVSSQTEDSALHNTDANQPVRRFVSATNDTSAESGLNAVDESVIPTIVDKVTEPQDVADNGAEASRITVRTDITDSDVVEHPAPTHRNRSVSSEPDPAFDARGDRSDSVSKYTIESTDQTVRSTVAAKADASTHIGPADVRTKSREQVHVERPKSTAGDSHSVNVAVSPGDVPEVFVREQDAVRPALADSQSALAGSTIEERDGKLARSNDIREKVSLPRTDNSIGLPRLQPSFMAQDQTVVRQSAAGDLHRSAVVPVEVQEAVSAIRRAVSGDSHIRIQLNPPELGIMQVEIVRSGGSTIARLETHNAAAHQAIVDTLGNLQKALAQTGAGVERVEVILNESRSEPSRHGRDRQDGEQSSERQRDRGDNPHDRDREDEQKRRRHQQDASEDELNQRPA